MKQTSPSAQRNVAAIGQILDSCLPPRGLVLEIASGSGFHVANFAKRFPHLEFQPSDKRAEALASIDAWRKEESLTNVAPPIAFDVCADFPAHLPTVDAVICINMVHVSPWSATTSLLAHCGNRLAEGGILYLYGPYFIEGVETAPSNLEFDQWCRMQDPSFGVRQLEEVLACANTNGLVLKQRLPMPANNYSLIFRRS